MRQVELLVEELKAEINASTGHEVAAAVVKLAELLSRHGQRRILPERTRAILFINGGREGSPVIVYHDLAFVEREKEAEVVLGDDVMAALGEHAEATAFWLAKLAPFIYTSDARKR